MKFMTVVYGLIFFVVGAVIVLTVLPALLPTFYNSLNTSYYYSYCGKGWNATKGACDIGSYVKADMPLKNLWALDGILPLVLVAAVFVALVIGAITLINARSKKR